MLVGLFSELKTVKRLSLDGIYLFIIFFSLYLFALLMVPLESDVGEDTIEGLITALPGLTSLTELYLQRGI